MLQSKLSCLVSRIKPSPTIAVSTKAQEMKAAGRSVINLGSGEPDFDTPSHIKAAANQALADGQTKYTAVGGTPELKLAIVNKFQQENKLSYAPENIIVSTGAKQSLMNLMLAVLDADDEVVIPAPYWVSYPDMALLAAAKPVVVVPSSGQKLCADQLISAITSKTKMLILNSPSNPSGQMYSADELSALATVLANRPDIIIASDDIYEHIRYDGRSFTNILNVAPKLKNQTVVINGVSKCYAMTGWRIGYAAGEKSLVQAMTKIQSQSTSNPCSVAQAAAAAALNSGTDCIMPMLESFDRRRRFVHQSLNRLHGVSCNDIEGAFYAFANAKTAINKAATDGKIPNANDLDFCSYLLETAEVACVPGSAFGFDGYFRISFATSDENLATAMDRLQKTLN